MVRADRFLNRVTLALCEIARRDTRRIIESRTLKNALACRLERPTPRVAVARLSVPHYWAVYYEGGRGPVKPRNGKFLVYFRNIEDDPRISGTASPERHAKRKRLALSPETFRRLVANGKMIVIPNSKQSQVGSSVAKPFFQPLEQFQNRARPFVSRRFSSFVRQSLREVDQLRFRRSVTIRI